MVKTFPAVYEQGVLRPFDPLPLNESQHVSVSISDLPDDVAASWLDHEYMAAIDAAQEIEPSLDDVRRVLGKIPGSLADDIRAERDARG